MLKLSAQLPRAFRQLFCLLLAFGLFASSAFADSEQERRVRTGARLFRSLLAADVAIEKRAATDGSLQVVILGSEQRLSRQMGELIAPNAQAQIRNHTLRIRLLSNFTEVTGAPPVAVFLSSVPPEADFDALVRWAIARKVILYSPFEGHVERGALAGISIEAKVLPYINVQTLKASGIELKPFFLKVAKRFPLEAGAR